MFIQTFCVSTWNIIFKADQILYKSDVKITLIIQYNWEIFVNLHRKF